MCLIHVAKKKPRRTESNLSNWRIDQVSKGNSIRRKMYGYTWTHLPRRWKKMARATPMTDSTWLQGTRRHAPHFSQKARVFLSLSLSLSATPSTDSPHPTFPYSLSRCIPLFSSSASLYPCSSSSVSFFSSRNFQFLCLVCRSCISSLVLFAIFISRMIFQSILNFCLSMINVGRCWSWNGENVKDRRRKCAEVCDVVDGTIELCSFYVYLLVFLRREPSFLVILVTEIRLFAKQVVSFWLYCERV